MLQFKVAQANIPVKKRAEIYDKGRCQVSGVGCQDVGCRENAVIEETPVTTNYKLLIRIDDLFCDFFPRDTAVHGLFFDVTVGLRFFHLQF